jgi:hypothetical protein
MWRLVAGASVIARWCLLTSLAVFSTNIFVVDCKLLFLPRKVVDSPHDRRSLGSALPNDGLALLPIQEFTIAPV